MAGAIDSFILEKEIGSDFARKLQLNLRGAIKSTTKLKSGLAMKSTVNPVYKNNELFSLLIKTPYYIYPILDLGFEKSKKDGINARIQKRDILIKALENGRLVENLADAIGNLRATSIVSRIAFAFDKNLQTSNSLNNE
jgi:hypothetical protein